MKSLLTYAQDKVDDAILNLKELCFKCETTEQNIEDGTLNISWN